MSSEIVPALDGSEASSADADMLDGSVKPSADVDVDDFARFCCSDYWEQRISRMFYEEKTFSSSIDNEVNMTNCYNQLQRFFERYKSIHYKVLIAYWMKAGYLGPVRSAEQAYRKGRGVLMDLLFQERVLKVSDDMIEFVAPEAPADPFHMRCRHGEVDLTKNYGYFDCLDHDEIGNVVFQDGKSNMNKGSYDLISGSSAEKRLRLRLQYVAHFSPRPNSLNPLLENMEKPLMLLLRGCVLFPLDDFPFEKFKTLAALEITAVLRLTALPEVISDMTQLQSLKLCHLPINHLPSGLFSNLTQLRWLSLRGCYNLRRLPKVSMLTQLQHLDLSGISNLDLSMDNFDNLMELRDLVVEGPFRISSFPSLTNSTKLETLHIIQDFNDPDTVFKASSLRHLSIESVRFTDDWGLFMRRVGKLETLVIHACDCLYDVEWQLKGFTSLEYLDLTTVDILSVDFVSDMIHLRGLVLRECSRIEQLPAMKNLTKLELLDISKCASLTDLPEDLCDLKSLKILNLSKCYGLKKLREGLFDQMLFLHTLGLDELPVRPLPSLANLTSLRKLSLKRLWLESLEFLACLINLVELNLSELLVGCSTEVLSEDSYENLQILDLSETNMESLENLQILNLSETKVKKLPDISKLVNLKQLLLADCTDLMNVPDLRALTNLEVLDLSRKSTCTSFQEESESPGDEKLQFVLAPSSLRKLILANRPGALELFPWTSLGNMEYLDITEIGEIGDHIRDQLSKMESLQVVGLYGSYHPGFTWIVDECHVVSCISNQASGPSGFDRFKAEFIKLHNLIAKINEMIFKSGLPVDTTSNSDITDDEAAIKRRFGSIFSDLRYIHENIDLLQSSRNGKSSEWILNELVDAATLLSADDFTLGSTNLKELLKAVVKLKLSIPPKQLHGLEMENEEHKKKKKKKKKKESLFTRNKNKEKVVTEDRFTEFPVIERLDQTSIKDLLSTYESLTQIEKNCLMCFSVFPCTQRLVVKKRILIHWWLGEEFIEPQHQENPGMGIISTDTSSARNVVNLASTTTNFEETGRRILKVLEEKGFIQTMVNKRRESGFCCMQPYVHSFVAARAKEDGFFDFNHKGGKLTPHFTLSKRACLLKSQEDDFSSSYKVWEKYANSSKMLQCFETIRTVFNVNETIIYLKPEWFSKLKGLYVLHLGSWHVENEDVEAMDEKLLEQLKIMKQLRLLSLQGFSTIAKLPDSVCKLTNLKILNLTHCTYLEELPSDIGSLKNLIHLDLSNCSLLYMLPNGIRFLSKLEVLKGFVITYEDGGRQNRQACTLRDLSKLDKLRKLSLGVNLDTFPDEGDLRVVKEMKNLCNLKITWKKNYNECQEPHDAIEKESLRHSRWKQLKCWGQRALESDTQEDEEPRNNRLGNLKKLVLCCFPSETAPNWLHPSELQRLERLHILGGALETLPKGTEQHTWNVKTLQLKYLLKLDTTWPILKGIFPNMTYLEKHQCDKFIFFDCDGDGVWTEEN